MKPWVTLSLIIPFFLGVTNKALGQEIPPGYVEVEEKDVAPVETSLGDYQLIPYTERRANWTNYYGVSVSPASFEDFETPNSNDFFDEVYDQVFLTEIQFAAKRNISLGAYGVDLGVGILSASGADGRSLSLYPIRLGATLILDTIQPEPYVVPYGSAGAYTVVYSETLANVEQGGNTQVSFYGLGGVMFQLDWLDKDSARNALFESGIENTFLFAEVQYRMASAQEADPDFGGVSYSFGLKLEMD